MTYQIRRGLRIIATVEAASIEEARKIAREVKLEQKGDSIERVEVPTIRSGDNP